MRPVELSQMIKKLKFFIIFINGGILSLTDSHHNHHGQKPTMVGICHGGNMLGNRDISIGLDGVEEVGEFLGENTSVTTFSIRHRCHTHHLLSHSAQQILKFLHRQILKINKTQNS